MEYWDLYDMRGTKVCGHMMRGEPVPEGRLHLVVHICIFNSLGHMLVQRRHMDKAAWAGMWDVSVAGCAAAGEQGYKAAMREVGEELGILPKEEWFMPAMRFFCSEWIDEIYCINADINNDDIHLQSEEVMAVKWCDREEIFNMIDRGEFIPYSKSIIDVIFHFSKQRSLKSIFE